MCYNTKEIRIKNSTRSIRVNCGTCPSCLMEKAIKNKNLIDNHLDKNNVFIFFTLHYANPSCPYVYSDDIKSRKVITVYRDSHVYKRVSNNYQVKLKKVFGLCELGEKVNTSFRPDYIPLKLTRSTSRKDKFYRDPFLQHIKEDYFISIPTTPLHPDPVAIKSLNKYDKDKIGVLWFPDIINFFKRLKVNLQRHYGFDYTDGYFYIGEYGPTTMRPHFHGLVACKKEHAEIVKDTIVKSWPYGSPGRTRRFCQIAYEASSYVASYVNGTIHLPSFLQQKSFRPKVGHSKFFGCGVDAFIPKNVYENAEKGIVTYDAITYKDKVPVHVAVPYPLRILRNLFPRCKGYSKLTDNEVVLLYSGMRQVEDFDYKLWHRTPFSYYHGYMEGQQPMFERSITPYVINKFHQVTYDPEDVLHKKPKIVFTTDVPCFVDEISIFKKRLEKARNLFKCVTGKSDYDFGILVRDFYNKRASCQYLSQFNNLLPNQNIYAYDNNEILLQKPHVAPTLMPYLNDHSRLGANNNPIRCSKTYELTQMHLNSVKKAKVNDFVIDQITFNL